MSKSLSPMMGLYRYLGYLYNQLISKNGFRLNFKGFTLSFKQNFIGSFYIFLFLDHYLYLSSEFPLKLSSFLKKPNPFRL